MSRVVRAIIPKPKAQPVAAPVVQPSKPAEAIAPKTDAETKVAADDAAAKERERLRTMAGRQATILTGGNDPGFDPDAQRAKRKTLGG